MKHRNKKRYIEEGRKDRFTLLPSPLPYAQAAQCREKHSQWGKDSDVSTRLHQVNRYRPRHQTESINSGSQSTAAPGQFPQTQAPNLSCAKQVPTNPTSRLTHPPQVSGYRLTPRASDSRLAGARPAPASSFKIRLPTFTMTRQTPVDQDTGPTPGVPGTWLAPVDPRSSCIHIQPGPRPITTDSSTRHTPVNPGSRPNPANQYQVGLCRPKHQAYSLSDLGTKSASLRTPKPVVSTR